MKKFFKVLVLIPCLVFLVNCSKSSDKTAAGNNQCYNQGQYGQTYYNPNCQTNNNGYHMVNGQCLNAQNQVVQSQLCQNTGNSGYGQQCYGWYYYQGQPVYCGGYNCAGYSLQNQSGQWVQCQ